MRKQYIGIILYYIMLFIRILDMQQNEAVVMIGHFESGLTSFKEGLYHITPSKNYCLKVLYIQVNVMLVLSSWPILLQTF